MTGRQVANERFKGRLLAEERVVWSGRPRQGLLFTRWDLLLIPVSLTWCIFAVLMSTASFQRAPRASDLLDVGFGCVGLFFLVGRFAVDAWVRRDTFYAVTDRRVVIAHDGLITDFTAIPLGGLVDAKLIEGVNGRGSIRFGPPAATPWFPDGRPVWIPAMDMTPQFLAIAEVRKVFDLIQSGAVPG